MIEELKAATAEITAAYGDMGVNTLARMDAVKAVEMAKQEIVLNNVEYQSLKNEGQRTAFLSNLIGAFQEKVTEIDADRVAIDTRIRIADANIRCAKYVIIAKAGKLVA